MYYILRNKYSYNREAVYVLFETHTESRKEGTEANIVAICKKNNLKIENADIIDDSIVLKTGFNGYKNGSYYMTAILERDSGTTYRIVDVSGNVLDANINLLKVLIAENRVVNCRITNNKLESVGNYIVHTDEEFKKEIDKKYTAFKAKTKLLGGNIEFRYEVEGNEVKLAYYKGSDTCVRVPSFITTIKSRAFYNVELAEIILNTEIEHIGSLAFIDTGLEEIKVSSNVKFVGKQVGTKIKYRETGIEVNCVGI